MDLNHVYYFSPFLLLGLAEIEIEAFLLFAEYIFIEPLFFV